MDKFFEDFHLHSEFSEDCDTPVNEIIKTARLKGLTTLCFTDHNDLDYPTSHGESFTLDIDRYIPTIAKLRDENPDIDIRIGLEQGVMPTTCEKLANYSKEHPGLDFIICSLHVIDGMDPYFPEFWVHEDGSPKTAEEAYRRNYEDILYNVQHFNDYNVVGHLDYVMRYGPEDNPDFKKVNYESYVEKYYPLYKELIHEILKTVIESGKGIEINTKGLAKGIGFMHPHPIVLEMYKDMGGEILTIGSDAHDLEHLGYNVDKAKELARTIGFKYYTIFKNMEPEFIKL